MRVTLGRARLPVVEHLARSHSWTVTWGTVLDSAGTSGSVQLWSSVTTRHAGLCATSSAILAATSAILSSSVLRPLREASRGLTLRRASYVVSCTTGTSWSVAKRADSSLSAMLLLSALRRSSSAGVTNTIPTRDFARPLSISRSKFVPSGTSVSLNQTRTPSDTNSVCSSLAAPRRSAHAWQRKTSRRSGKAARCSATRRAGSSACTSAGVYATEEPAGDHLGLALLPEPTRLGALLGELEWEGGEKAGGE